MPQPELTHLGQPTTYRYDEPDASVLEWFPSPYADPALNRHRVVGTIHIEVPEFTCLCPITGQPDFANIIIDYIPRDRCVESKSLKLYMGRFRMAGVFHEACVNQIANDLIDLLEPEHLRVEGRFAARGGIPFVPIAEYRRPADG